MEDSVLIITEVFHPEEFLINDVARKWIADGKKVSVLTRNPAYPFGRIFEGYNNKLVSITEDEGMTIYRYHIVEKYRDSKFRKIINYIWNSILSTTIALLLMRRHKNIFIYHTGPLTMAISGVLLKKWNKGKVAIWTQDVWPEIAFAYGLKKTKLTNWLVNRFVNFIYKNSNTIIATSRPLQNDIFKRVHQMPAFIPNWPMNVFQNAVELSGNSERKATTFTFAGNIGSMQNLEIIVNAFHQWSANRKDASLLIYGDGSAFPGLQKLVSEKKMDNVYLKGRVPVTSIPGIYAASDVLIISLRSDEVLEKYVPAKFSTYLIAGKPILAVLAGAVSDYVNEYKLGYVAQPDDLTSIMQGFEFCASLTTSEREKIAESAVALYRNEFDSEVNLKKLTELVFN